MSDSSCQVEAILLGQGDEVVRYLLALELSGILQDEASRENPILVADHNLTDSPAAPRIVKLELDPQPLGSDAWAWAPERRINRRMMLTILTISWTVKTSLTLAQHLWAIATD